MHAQRENSLLLRERNRARLDLQKQRQRQQEAELARAGSEGRLRTRRLDKSESVSQSRFESSLATPQPSSEEGLSLNSQAVTSAKTSQAINVENLESTEGSALVAASPRIAPDDTHYRLTRLNRVLVDKSTDRKATTKPTVKYDSGHSAGSVLPFQSSKPESYASEYASSGELQVDVRDAADVQDADPKAKYFSSNYASGSR